MGATSSWLTQWRASVRALSDKTLLPVAGNSPDAGWTLDLDAERAWDEVLALEAGGKFRTAFLRVTELPKRFPGTLQAERALRRRGEILERLRLEVGDTLRALGLAESAYLREKDRYTTDLVATGWAGPAGRPAYTYGFLEACLEPDAGTPQATLTSDPLFRGQRGATFDTSEMAGFDAANVAALLSARGMSSTADCRPWPLSANGFVGVAVSNLDADEAPDVWAVFTTVAVEHVADDLEGTP